MNPVIIQALSAERVREMRENAAARRRAREARCGSRVWTRVRRIARGPKPRAVLRSLRDLTAA